VISHAGLFLLASCGTLGRRSRNPRVLRNPGWKTLYYVIKGHYWDFCQSYL